LLGDAKTLDHRFLVFFLRPAFFFVLAARMLSTRLGRLRPAFLAERLAAALRAGESFFEFFRAFLRGLGFFQGGFRAICHPSCLQTEPDNRHVDGLYELQHRTTAVKP
jgi:hypothetical protein